jgi:diadenosine tetraphosphate (Ap4A) HIT family hydrolase
MMSGFIAATANQMPPHLANHVAPKWQQPAFFAAYIFKN